MDSSPKEVIRVVGVGGGGVNAVNRMIEADLRGVEFIAINTDAQALLMSEADVKLEIGREQTRGLGAGTDPEVGKKSAADHIDQIREVLEGSDMVFVTAGEGGGTGTGAAPIVASVARELGALTVGVVTRPFVFEGPRRAQTADRGIEALREEVDALIVIPNERLLEINETNLSVMEAFRAADQVLHSSVQGITEIVSIPGIINVDFADLNTTLKDSKTALMGIGSATGPERALDAVEMAISSPLLETSMDGACRVLIFFQGGPDLGIEEMSKAAQMVYDLADPNVNFIAGYACNETFGDEVRVTVVAADFDGKEKSRKADTAKTVPIERSASRPAVTKTSQSASSARSAKPVASASEAAPTIAAKHIEEPAQPNTVRKSTGEDAEVVESVAARLAHHRTGKSDVPELKIPQFPSETGETNKAKAQSAEKKHNPEAKITELVRPVPELKPEPLAVTSGIRPVSPDAATVPNYVDSSQDQTAPSFRRPQVFDDITGKDEIDIPDFLR